MPALKLAHEVKLKDQSLEIKVALRLVTLAKQQKSIAEVRTLAKEIGSSFMDTIKAVELLAAKKVITFTAITANQFNFQVETENHNALKRDADALDRHLGAKAARKTEVAVRKKSPTHLVPFTQEQRGPWMTIATEIATKMGAPKLAGKVANCILRIGEDEVRKTLASAHLARKSTPRPALSVVALFFTLYSAKRDVLIQPQTDYNRR